MRLLNKGKIIALFAFSIFSMGFATAGISPIDCLTHKLRALISGGTAEEVLNFEKKLGRVPGGRSVAELETDLFALLDRFSEAHPTFPKDEFMDWWKASPLTETDLTQARKLSATDGNILDYRFQVFKLEQETTLKAKQISGEVLDAVKTCERDPICSKKKVTGIFRKHFSCTLNDRRVQSSLLAGFVVSNSSYLLASGASDKPFAVDLALNNAFFSPIMVERYCRRALGKDPSVKLSVKDQYRNLFLGKKNEFGVRPGFLRTLGSLEWEMTKFNAWWAASYKITNTASETLVREKKITWGRLEDLPEAERKNYITLNPASTLKDAGKMIFLFDLPVSSQRSIFVSSHLYTVALPQLIGNQALLFASQTGIKVGFGVLSTMMFQCWNDAGKHYDQKFLDCMKRNKNTDEKVEAIVTPDLPHSHSH